MMRGEREIGPWGLNRDMEEAVLLGVCAGLARRFGVGPWAVRILMLALLVLFTGPVLAAYLTAALLLPRRRLIGTTAADEREFWRQASREARFEQEDWT